jgi:hypothetical protein
MGDSHKMTLHMAMELPLMRSFVVLPFGTIVASMFVSLLVLALSLVLLASCLFHHTTTPYIPLHLTNPLWKQAILPPVTPSTSAPIDLCVATLHNSKKTERSTAPHMQLIPHTLSHRTCMPSFPKARSPKHVRRAPLPPASNHERHSMCHYHQCRMPTPLRRSIASVHAEIPSRPRILVFIQTSSHYICHTTTTCS